MDSTDVLQRLLSKKESCTIIEGNSLIKQKILDNDLFCAGKLGTSEFTVVQYIRRGLQISPFIRKLVALAGIFPDTESTFTDFYNIYTTSCRSVDIMGSWIQGDYDFLKSVNPSVDLVTLRSLEPYYFENPWSQALSGKKVTVVNNFSESIQAQYKLKELVWPDKSVLPDFDLQIVNTPYHAIRPSKYDNWIDVLSDIYEKTIATKPDFIIVGAGAYSIPLIAGLKECGIPGIHLGGAIQILFGIKGQRWDEHEVISKFYNDSWIRPSQEEVPEDYKQVENGCYW